MNISRKTDGDIDILCLEGRLDLASASKLKEMSREIAVKKNCKIILNMENVKFINSSGLGALVSILKDTRSANGSIKITNLASYVKEIFDITQLSSIFDIYDNDETAKSEFV